jgi:hypothetical protein
VSQAQERTLGSRAALLTLETLLDLRREFQPLNFPLAAELSVRSPTNGSGKVPRGKKRKQEYDFKKKIFLSINGITALTRR